MLRIKVVKLSGDTLRQRVIELCSHKTDSTERFFSPAKLYDRLDESRVI